MEFSYVAINSKYQKVTGSITAEDRERAKEQLHKVGLSVLKMAESAGEPLPEQGSNIQTFWFLIRDQNGQESSGTIEAHDRKTALRRLISEYKFEVLALCESSVAEAERLTRGKEGLPELTAEVQEEFGIDTSPKKGGEENSMENASRQFSAQKKQILEEVESVTKKAEEILEKHKEQMTGEEFRSMKTNLDTLMRIKLSNNIPYIQSLAEDLFESIRRVVLHYETPGLATAVTSSDDQGRHLEENYTDELQSQIHQKAVRNASVLGRLKSISEHLNILNTSFHRHEGQTSASVPRNRWEYFSRILGGGLKVITSFDTAKRTAARAELRQLRQDWKNQQQEREAAVQKLPLILAELRVFSSWLLGFYIGFFYLAEYALLKGWFPFLPFLQELFATPFLIFFAAFLFCSALALSLWEHFFRERFLFFGLSAATALLLFVLFVNNF